MKKTLLFLSLVVFGTAIGFVSAQFGGRGLSDKEIMDLAMKRGWVQSIDYISDHPKSFIKSWPKKTVRRQELANGFFTYDVSMEIFYKHVRNIICLNKTNFINNLGAENITDKNTYMVALSALCSPWRPGFGVESCAVGTGYNALTGEPQEASAPCLEGGPGGGGPGGFNPNP